MRSVIQRVKSAKVTVDGKIVSEIGTGLLILFGVSKDSKREDLDHLVKKTVNLRIFDDGHGKMNLSIKDIGGEILLVSQFTLYASTEKGNRPSFDNAMPPEEAEQLYREFTNRLKSENINVKTGVFGEYMQISLVNDGPVTIIMPDIK